MSKGPGPAVSAKTIYLVSGSPTTADKEEEVRRWYEPHLIEMCTLPGLMSAQLFRPSSVQLPRLTTCGARKYDSGCPVGSYAAM